MTSSQLGERAGPAGLPEVADQRHRPRRAAAGEHAPLHRGEVLRLVDQHVAEGARLAVVIAGAGRRVARRSGRARRPALVNPPTPSSSTVRRACSSSGSRRARRRERGRAALGGPSRESASSTSGRSASVQATSATSGSRARKSSRCSAVGEHTTGRRSDERVEPEEVVHELAAAEHRPHAVERGADLGQAAQPGGELVLPLRAARLPRAPARRRPSDPPRSPPTGGQAGRGSRRHRAGRGRPGTRERARAGTRAGSDRAPARRRSGRRSLCVPRRGVGALDDATSSRAGAGAARSRRGRR